MLHEISRLLAKEVIAVSEHEHGEFIYPIFLRSKSDGGFRMILNLKKLNQVSEYEHFKMDTLKSVLTLVYPDVLCAKLTSKMHIIVSLLGSVIKNI